MRKALLWLMPQLRRYSYRWITTAALAGALVGDNSLTNFLQAAPPERPTFNHTEDPRPNILPNWIFNHHVPYRLQYNRPTYHGGKIAYHIAPSSQEAMVWEENLEAGRYNGHNCPPVYKRYMYLKPWEALNTGPRPSFAQATPNQATPNQAAPNQAAAPVVNEPAPAVNLQSSELVPAAQ